MASLLSPTTNSLQQNRKINCLSSSKSSFPNNYLSFSNRFGRCKCSALFGSIPEDVVEQSMSGLQSGFVELQSFSDDLSDFQKWGLVVFGGLTWVYLTARPGVLVGAIDAYLLAPLQLGFDNLTGRRSLKRTDFVIGNKIGEGSFGVVYAGAVVPKDVSVEDRGEKRGRGRSLETDSRFKKKVILKKVKMLIICC